MLGSTDLEGTENVAPAADWLPGLARAMGGGAMPPRDPRVRQLYELLRQRQLWGRSPRMRRVLRFAWQRGLAARQRPRLGQWFTRRLARWGLLSGQQVPVATQVTTTWAARRPFRRVGLRPVQVRRVQPVRVTAGQPLRRARR